MITGLTFTRSFDSLRVTLLFNLHTFVPRLDLIYTRVYDVDSRLPRLPNAFVTFTFVRVGLLRYVWLLRTARYCICATRTFTIRCICYTLYTFTHAFTPTFAVPVLHVPHRYRLRLLIRCLITFTFCVHRAALRLRCALLRRCSSFAVCLFRCLRTRYALFPLPVRFTFVVCLLRSLRLPRRVCLRSWFATDVWLFAHRTPDFVRDTPAAVNFVCDYIRSRWFDVVILFPVVLIVALISTLLFIPRATFDLPHTIYAHYRAYVDLRVPVWTFVSLVYVGLHAFARYRTARFAFRLRLPFTLHCSVCYILRLNVYVWTILTVRLFYPFTRLCCFPIDCVPHSPLPFVTVAYALPFFRSRLFALHVFIAPVYVCVTFTAHFVANTFLRWLLFSVYVCSTPFRSVTRLFPLRLRCRSVYVTHLRVAFTIPVCLRFRPVLPAVPFTRLCSVPFVTVVLFV